MDPNANLQEQLELVFYRVKGATDKAHLRDLRHALADWLSYGGFQPTWKEYPKAAKAFRAWCMRYRHDITHMEISY